MGLTDTVNRTFGILDILQLNVITIIVIIEFDESKRALVLAHRSLDMADAHKIFEGKTLTISDDRMDYGEDRFITIGYFDKRMVVLVWTRRGNVRRIISLRKANDREQTLYEKRLA